MKQIAEITSNSLEKVPNEKWIPFLGKIMGYEFYIFHVCEVSFLYCFLCPDGSSINILEFKDTKEARLIQVFRKFEYNIWKRKGKKKLSMNDFRSPRDIWAYAVFLENLKWHNHIKKDLIWIPSG